MWSNQVTGRANRCHHAKRSDDRETFVSKSRVNDEKCGLWPRPVETTHPLEVHPIWAAESSVACHNIDPRSRLLSHLLPRKSADPTRQFRL